MVKITELGKTANFIRNIFTVHSIVGDHFFGGPYNKSTFPEFSGYIGSFRSRKAGRAFRSAKKPHGKGRIRRESNCSGNKPRGKLFRRSYGINPVTWKDEQERMR
jgi:hypothetical protein